MFTGRCDNSLVLIQCFSEAFSPSKCGGCPRFSEVFGHSRWWFIVKIVAYGVCDLFRGLYVRLCVEDVLIWSRDVGDEPPRVFAPYSYRVVLGLWHWNDICKMFHSVCFMFNFLIICSCYILIRINWLSNNFNAKNYLQLLHSRFSLLQIEFNHRKYIL